MRIHKTPIVRQTNLPEENDYHKYEDALRIDFHECCGYCGKPFYLSTRGMEIDHFVPQRIAEERRNDYSNLVYSCFTCNRKKGKKWPTEDPSLQNDGKVGFVDPATEEYNEHLTRQPDGRINALTPVGTYMSDEVFLFPARPIKTVWKVIQLLEFQKKIEKLYSEQADIAPELAGAYIQTNQYLKELFVELNLKKE